MDRRNPAISTAVSAIKAQFVALPEIFHLAKHRERESWENYPFMTEDPTAPG